MDTQILTQKIEKLLPAQKEQVMEFVEFLEQKNKQRPRPKFGSGKGMFEMSPDFDVKKEA